ncbi:MAG: PorT family protein [Flavobacterium sp.]|nr:MAG: PorT family protein [Flavobacterium sp.]
MNEKKNLDRLFQEKFKDFEVTPPEIVWENIEAELQGKKKRRVIPLWLKLSGVAAVFILGLLTSMPFFDDGGIDAGDAPVVIENTTQPNGDNATDKVNPVNEDIIPGNDNAVTTTNAYGNTDASTTDSAKSNSDELENDSRTGNGSSNIRKNKIGVSSESQNNNAVAYDRTQQKKSDKNIKGNRRKNTIPNTRDAVAYRAGNNKSRNNNRNNETGSVGLNGAQSVTGSQGDAKGIVSGLGNDNDPEKAIKSNMPDNNAQPGTNEIIDVPIIERQVAVNETVKDSIPVAPENELEKLLREKELGKEKDKTAVAEANNNKWRIKPQMAPVFYNSMSKGSPIDSELASNSKDYNNDFSYGVGIDYAISKKISVRTGVNTVNLGYTTNGIEFYADMNNQTSNVSPASRKANIVVQNQGTSTGTNTIINDQFTKQTFNGSMLQKMGYIEVPLEMSYKLVDRKFGIDIIGGVSTLFLNENSVSVVSDQGLSSTIGQAENLNNINFSTNLGIGFKYRFWKSFEANFEPTFKYQVNTFSSNAGNFKPYIIGLYSGVSFSF